MDTRQKLNALKPEFKGGLLGNVHFFPNRQHCQAGKNCVQGSSAVVLELGIPPKTSRGDLAPVAWQLGNKKEVLEYCAHDVWILRELWNRFHDGGLVDPNDGSPLFPIP